METYATRLLKQVLDRCHKAPFSEIRFISGMSPAYVDKAGPHFIRGTTLSTDIVYEIHQLCCLLADEAVQNPESSSAYTFVLRRLGRFFCKYQRVGNVASLILLRDEHAPEYVEAIRPRKRPMLRAEAKPDS